MLGASPSSRARSRQLGHTAYRAPHVAGKRGAFLGAGTTLQRCAAVGESCNSPRGTETGFPFTSTVASIDVKGKPVSVPRGELRSEEHTSELQSRQYLLC